MRNANDKKWSLEKYPRCIWMQAGVVEKRLCRSDFDCIGCRFDRVMKSVANENILLKQEGELPGGKRTKIIPWRDRLKSLPAGKRPCIHHMKNRIEFRTCTNEYRCGNCDFDQYFIDQFSVHAMVNPVNVLEVKGFRIPQGYYFHQGHTWMKIEKGSSVKVGVDDFALRLMGPLDRIEAPLMGKEVRQGRAQITALRGSHRANLVSPISGIVTAINSSLREQGRLANQDPYGKGWVMQVKADGLRQDLKNLMINRETGDFMEGQVERLYKVIEETAGPLAADGGYLGNDIFGNMPQLGWGRLMDTFLKIR